MVNKIMLVLMLLVIAAGVGCYVYLKQIEWQNTEQTEHLTASVEKASDALSAKVLSWRQAIESLAQDPALLASINNNEQGLTDWVVQHRASLDEITMLRVIRPGLMQIDVSVKPPLGYAGLDLVRKVEEYKEIQMPEVHMMGSDNQHIAIAAPVVEGDELKVVILVSLDVTALQHVFKSALGNEHAGWLELKQRGLMISSAGAASHQSASNVGAIQIAGTHWRIVMKKQVTPAPITMAELGWYIICLLVVILALSRLLTRAINKGRRKRMSNIFRAGKIKEPREPALETDNEETLLTDNDEILSKEEIAETIKGNIVQQEEVASSPAFMNETGIEVVSQTDVPESIFRAYDIRGIVDETLTEQVVFLIGRAIATEALNVGQATIAIARDGRLHSSRLSEALSRGIKATGCNVIDVGQVPTPVLYFATHQLDTQSGVMITGSHNPANYNGLKIVIAGNTLSGDAIQKLYQRILQEDFESGEGTYQEQMMLPEYIGAITSDVRLGRMMKVVVDCGNGVAGEAAPMLLSTLGCEVIPLYCDIDGNFPNHHPDPSKPENLQELIDKVREEEAELGLAFDGDGDRLGVIDSDGNVIWPDRQMMLYAMDVLSRQAGADIIYDVKCTRNLAKVIAKHGGKAIMSKTGHSLIKAKMKETNAELAGEMSGHIFFKERWFGFDDALYTAARLLEILTAEFRSTVDIFADLPDSVSTPELNVSLEEGENFIFVEQLQSQATFEGGNVITIDGVRVEFKDGWGLVRASNTTPSLVLRFEADDEAALARIKEVFREQMLNINKSITLPF